MSANFFFVVRAVALGIRSLGKMKFARPQAAFEAVIGIESHVRLSTRTKAFCGCANVYGAKPNTHVCPVCLGHPVGLQPRSEPLY